LAQELVQALRRQENVKIRELLGRLDAETVNEAGAFGLTPLHMACETNHVEAVAKLLSIPGIDVNARSSNGWTAIMSAAAVGSTEVLKLLMENPEVEVNAGNNLGRTALMWAAACCEVQTLGEMLKHPAVDIDLAMEDGRVLEEMVGEKVNNSIQKLKCLDMIKETRRRREYVSPSQELEQYGKGAEEVRDDVTQHFKDQIEKINCKIEEKEKKIEADIGIKNAIIEELKQKWDAERKTLDIESNQEKTKLEQELVALQASINELPYKNKKKADEMNKKYEIEITMLKEKIKIESEDDQQLLASLQATTDQLAKGLKRLNLEPQNEPINLKALRDTLECPVCTQIMMPPTRIWMCSNSHLVCQDCAERIERRLCPTCRVETLDLRARMAENFSRTLFKRKKNLSNM